MCMVALLMLSGCGEMQGQNNVNLETVSNVQGVTVGTSFDWEQKFTEKNQQSLIKTSQPPKLTYSLERENLIRKYEFLNDRDKVFYIYLMSYGRVVTFYVAKGKISSVNSRLTQEQQVIDAGRTGMVYRYSGTSSTPAVVDSPQLDGSYGTNGDAIFFFTTEGAYVEWNGEYLVSDFPLTITTPLQLTKEVK